MSKYNGRRLVTRPEDAPPPAPNGQVSGQHPFLEERAVKFCSDSYASRPEMKYLPKKLLPAPQFLCLPAHYRTPSRNTGTLPAFKTYTIWSVKIPACYRLCMPTTAEIPAVVKNYRHAGSAVVKLCISTLDLPDECDLRQVPSL